MLLVNRDTVFPLLLLIITYWKYISHLYIQLAFVHKKNQPKSESNLDKALEISITVHTP